MITRVFLVRHGATPLTADDRFAGSSDVPLGREGRIHPSKFNPDELRRMGER